MKIFIYLFIFIIGFLVAQEKSLNKSELIDIGEIDSFMERDNSFLENIKRELKNENRNPFTFDFNYNKYKSSQKGSGEEFIDNQFSFLMSYPYHHEIFFNVDRLIEENFYSFFVQAKNLEKTESSQGKNDFIVNGGYNAFNMGASLEFNFSRVKIDFLFSATEEGSQTESPNFNKIFSKKLKIYFYHKDIFVKDLSLAFLLNYGNFYSEPNYSFLPIQQSYTSAKLALVFNQLKSAYEGWAIFFDVNYDYWVKEKIFRTLSDLRVDYFFSISDFNFLLSGGGIISVGSNPQILPNINLSSQFTKWQNIRIKLSFLLKSDSKKLEEYFQEGQYTKHFDHHNLDYFFRSQLKASYQLKDTIKITFTPYSTYYFNKNISIFDENNPLFFENNNVSFSELGTDFNFFLNLGKIISLNSKLEICKVNSIHTKINDASGNFDKNINIPFLLSVNTIGINLKPIASKINFSLYTTFDHWLMNRYIGWSHNVSNESSSNEDKGKNYQKVDSLDASFSYFFQYSINLSFYLYFNNLFDNVVYRINTLKLKRGRNLEFGLEYKF